MNNPILFMFLTDTRCRSTSTMPTTSEIRLVVNGKPKIYVLIPHYLKSLSMADFTLKVKEAFRAKYRMKFGESTKFYSTHGIQVEESDLPFLEPGCSMYFAPKGEEFLAEMIVN